MLLERTGWRHILTCHVLGNWAWNMFWNRLSTWSRHMSSNYSIASWLLAIFRQGSRRWSYSFCLDWTISNGVLIGLPVYLVRRLQSVLNAAARMIVILPFLRRSDHITDALVNLHWLRVPKRIHCLRTKCWKGLHRLIWVRLFVRLIYRLPGRRGLRSASTTRLVVPPNSLSTIGNRIFEVTAAQT